MLIILAGPGGSGKSTLEKKLIKTAGCKKIVSTTSRPQREGEVDGIDYYFIDKKEFIENKDKYVCVEEYNDWLYGVNKEVLDQCIKDKQTKYIIVLTPSGVEEINKLYKVYNTFNAFGQTFKQNTANQIITIYLDVDYESRLEKMLSTRENKKECYRRAKADQERFKDFEKQATFIVRNKKYMKNIEKIQKEALEYIEKY